MKRLYSKFAVAVGVALVSAATVFVVQAATPTPTPVQGAKPLAVILSADTVSGIYGYADNATEKCAQTNLFHPGQMVVFRMWANDVKNGGYPVTPATVQKGYPVINIPGVKPAVAMSYVGEPYTAPVNKQIGYWEAHWTIPSNYPLGVINFNITVKTLPATVGKTKIPALTGTYSQKGFSSESQLQVVPATTPVPTPTA